MNTSRRRLLIGAILLLIMAGAGVLLNFLAAGLAYADSDTKAAAVDPSLVSANTGFAVRLLRELQSSQRGSNVFISPLSVSVALTMAYDGAGTTTKDAIAQTLGIEGMSDEEINAGYLNLLGSLTKADESVALRIGDSVWIKDSFAPSVKKTFTDALSKYYLSEVYTSPFDGKTVTDVNSWVSKATNGKITKMVDNIDSGTVMFLINAIYFKGDWVDKFEESQTHKADFTTTDGSTVQVDMMAREGSYAFYDGENVKIARIPYGRDKIAMYVFLPAEGSSLEEFISGLTGDSLNNYFSQLFVNKLDLQMPKLKLEYGKVDLKDALTSMGMGVAFDHGAADFGGIADVSPDRLYIQFVDHKAVVEVNEQGTEAAAVTNVGIGVTSAPVTTPFVVDRPYMFVIRDDRSGSILFSGLISDPTVEASP
jgi:serine protease inhibitor